MPSQPQEIPPRHWVPKLQLKLVTLLLMCCGASAQTVYRCGDLYKADAACDKTATQTTPDRPSVTQINTQQALTRQAQQEADALEKNRISAERQTAQPASPWGTFPQDKALAQSRLEPETTHTPSPRGKRRAASPYFTAKDGSGSTKTKSKKSAGKTKATAKP
jgi:hypothetical protein